MTVRPADHSSANGLLGVILLTSVKATLLADPDSGRDGIGVRLLGVAVLGEALSGGIASKAVLGVSVLMVGVRSVVGVRLLVVVTELGVGGSGVAYVRVTVGVCERLLIVRVVVAEGVSVELRPDIISPLVMNGLGCSDISLAPGRMNDVSKLISGCSCT